ncbi:MAG: type IV toxin-antitoxin system AbiEi family antitoxin domain-containing protein [Thermosynechococcaceae cyanobacterium]
MKSPGNATAAQIRNRIEQEAGKYWRPRDFPELPPYAVSQTLSRLVKSGIIERVSKGLYYRPRPTRFGQSRASESEIQSLSMHQKVMPAGISAANLLGFSTQNVGQGEFATAAASVPRKIIGQSVRLHTRRPEVWNTLSWIEAGLLDLLRTRCKYSELTEEETQERLLLYLGEGDRYERLAEIAKTEPPRVRAMLGALGQELQKSSKHLDALRQSLNPISRFEFGKLRTLRYAKEWQDK